MSNRTFAIIKPDAVKNNYTGLIYDRILKAHFKILCSKLIKMTKVEAENFYSIHKEKPFFSELIDYITSGPIVQVVLEGNSAIEVVRQMVGATNSLKAASGTIRGDFGLSHTENVIHASDSVDSFEREFNILSNI